MAAPGFFPLLVEASWGSDPPKNLSAKLQMYFQSPKRSGGGECEVRQEPGHPARFLVLFRENGEGRPGRRGEGTSRLFPRRTLELGYAAGESARPQQQLLRGEGGCCRMETECGAGGSRRRVAVPPPRPRPRTELASPLRCCLQVAERKALTDRIAGYSPVDKAAVVR